MGTIARRTGDSSTYPAPGSRGLAVSITPRTIWLVVAIAAVSVGVMFVVVRAISILILLYIAIIFAEGIRPIVNWLDSHHVPRPLAVILVYLGVLLILAGLAWFLLRPLVEQLASFVSDLPRYTVRAQALVSQVQRLVSSNPQAAQAFKAIQGQLGSLIGSIAPALLAMPLRLGELIFDFVVVIFMAFFWLTGVENLRPFTISLLPPQAQDTGGTVLAEMQDRLNGYVRGVFVNMWVIGVLSGAGLFFLGVPYPLLLGVVAGLTELLPYIGPWISGSVAVIVALVTVGPILAVEVIVLYVLIQEIEGHTLMPVVMNRAVALNPLTVIVTVLIGASLLGIIGAVLAVPTASIIKVLIVRVIAPTVRRAGEHLSASNTSEFREAPAENAPSPASSPS